MRTFLRGVTSRVARLQTGLRPCRKDLAHRIRLMSDEELQLQIAGLARRSGVPGAAIAQTSPVPESWRMFMAAIHRHEQESNPDA